VTLSEGVQSTGQVLHLLVEVTGLFMHGGLGQLACNLLELVGGDLNVVRSDNVGSFGREATLDVKVNGF